MGKELAPRIAARLGRSLLELGGNNAAIVAPSADLDLVVRGVLFSAVGTAGQRCTSLRRLIVHESIADEVVERLAAAYRSVPIGDPREPGTLVGPLVSGESFERLEDALARGARGRRRGRRRRRAGARRELARRVVREPDARPDAGADGGRRAGDVRADPLRAHVLASPTRRSRSRTASRRDSPRRSSRPTCARPSASSPRSGSDCGIANVNIGPSGAEIGGAFGGEKETGGGRESGSDAWKAYMRRQTATVNFTSELPLAQGIVFDVA